MIQYDPEIELFRGEFISLNGGADFYAASVDELHREAEQSLSVYLAVCAEKGIAPTKPYSGKFNARIPAELHQQLVLTAQAQGKSLNDFVKIAIENELAKSIT